jgi:hypothetical protein
MPLSEDQKAMLRLLAQREQGYDDIAALMGLSVDEVRARVKKALAELDEEKRSEPAGKAAPADAEPPPFREPPPAAPSAAEPTAAAKPASRRPSPRGPKLSRPSLPGLPKDEGALRGLLAGGAVVIVIVLLLVTGVLGGGDDGGSSTTAAGESTSAESTSNEGAGSGEASLPSTGGKVPTQAVLKEVNGSGGSGRALFVRSNKSVLLLLVARGLQPSPAGQSYTVSLVRSPSERLPLIATKAGKNGVISGRFQVAVQVLGLLAGGFDEMEVSLVPDDELRVALAEARKNQKAPSYGGEAVLSGTVTGPIVEAGSAG